MFFYWFLLGKWWFQWVERKIFLSRCFACYISTVLFPFLYIFGTFGIVVVSLWIFLLVLWCFWFLVLIMNLIRFIKKREEGIAVSYVLVIKKKKNLKLKIKALITKILIIFTLYLFVYVSQPLWLWIYHWHREKPKLLLALRKVFWCFQGVSKDISGMKWVKELFPTSSKFLPSVLNFWLLHSK